MFVERADLWFLTWRPRPFRPNPVAGISELDFLRRGRGNRLLQLSPNATQVSAYAKPAASSTISQSRNACSTAHIDDAFKADPIVFATSAVFELLSEKITAGEIRQVRHALPADIRALWPLPSQTA